MCVVVVFVINFPVLFDHLCWSVAVLFYFVSPFLLVFYFLWFLPSVITCPTLGFSIVPESSCLYLSACSPIWIILCWVVLLFFFVFTSGFGCWTCLNSDLVLSFELAFVIKAHLQFNFLSYVCVCY